MAEDEYLEAINAKLGAILALMLESRIRDSETIDRRKARSLEQLLKDAGLPNTEIATLLGKSARYVRGVVGEGR